MHGALLESFLTERENEVLSFLLEGHAINDIAGELCLSPHTVRNYTKAIFRKTAVHSRRELIIRYRTKERDESESTAVHKQLSLLDDLGEAIVLMQQGQVVYCSRGFYRMWQISGEATEAPGLLFCHLSEAVRDFPRFLQLLQKPGPWQTAWCRSDGHRFLVESRSSEAHGTMLRFSELPLVDSL